MYIHGLGKFWMVWVLLALVSLGVVAVGETLHLGADQKWRDVSEEAEGEYLLAVMEIKRQINSGQIEAAQGSVIRLKERFAEFAGGEIDGFMKAEMLYAEGKWVKAVRKYDEFLDMWPGSKLFESALEREYSVAIAFLNGEKRKALKFLRLSGYDEAEKIMHRIAELTGDAPIAKRGLVAVAEGFENRKKFLDAYEAWADISTRWPTGEMGQNALLGMARSLHSAYHGPDYDASSLASAQSYYENFKLRYPTAAAEYDIDGKIEMISEQLAYKEFRTGEYYYKTGNITAANLYYRRVLDKWPKSGAGKMAHGKIELIAADPEAGQGEKDVPRLIFDGVVRLLDSWFGFEKMLVREEQ